MPRRPPLARRLGTAARWPVGVALTVAVHVAPLHRIESWARAGDRLSTLLPRHLRMSKEVQLNMWTSTLERVIELAGGRPTGGIEIRTHRVDDA